MTLTKTNRIRKLLLTALLAGLSLPLSLMAVSTISRADTVSAPKVPVRKILDNGPDKDRYVLLILGEGYTKQQQQLYSADVDELIIKGLLGHDFFHDNIKAFNVYVADTWSNSSGPRIGKGPKKDTAFNITFNDNAWSEYFGDWMHDPKTLTQLATCVDSAPSRPDQVIMLVNTNHKGHGGENLANFITLVSTGDNWQSMQHEMGHAIGLLRDEYAADGNRVYNGPPYQHGNSTTYGDRYNVPWAAWIDPATPVPTPFWFTPKNGIGVFTGGATYSKGTFKPSMHCRMNENEDSFCKVCKDYMTLRLNQKNPDPNNPLAVATRGLTVSPGFNPATINKNIVSTFGFNLTRSTLLGPPEPKPLPFQTAPDLPNLDIVLQAFDKSGSSQTKQMSNPFVLRSFPAKGKKSEFTRLLDKVNIGFRLPVSYDPVKEGFGVRLYKVNPDKKIPTIAEIQGKDKPVTERVSEQSIGKPAPPKPVADPHVTLPPAIDQETLERMKKEAKVTLIKEFPAK